MNARNMLQVQEQVRGSKYTYSLEVFLRVDGMQIFVEFCQLTCMYLASFSVPIHSVLQPERMTIVLCMWQGSKEIKMKNQRNLERKPKRS